MKNKKTVGRYTLTITQKDDRGEKCYNIPFFWGQEVFGVEEEQLQKALINHENKPNLPLSIIDYFTTQFCNEKELIEYINDYYLYGELYPSLAKAKITYNQDGVQEVPIAYRHNKGISTLSTYNFNLSDIKNLRHSYCAVNQVIEEAIQNGEGIVNSIFKQKLLRRDLAFQLEKCVQERKENGLKIETENMRQAAEMLKSYKEYRNLILTSDRYHKIPEEQPIVKKDPNQLTLQLPFNLR